jgi:hypothetical protein
MPPEKLIIHQTPQAIGESLSALVLVGADFWLAADEGTSLATAKADGGNEWSTSGTHDLVALLDLPGKALNGKGELPEVDAEGMQWDGKHLWIVASHSLKRKQPKDDKKARNNFKRLAEVTADGNRYLLGRLPLDQKGDLLQRSAGTAEHCAARLPCDLFSSDLLEELRQDKLLGRYLRASGKKSRQRNLPGKDNGLDIEGLAVIGADELLIGLRGPVLRGWALALQVRLSCGDPLSEGQPAMLRLEKIGERKYRRLAFQLGQYFDAGEDEPAAAGGLGVRDLCFDENGDLLILAGPTMALPWPVQVFRWPGAREKLAENTHELFIWAEDLRLELDYTPPSVKDRAESLCILGSGNERRLVIGYDNKKRRSENGDLTLDAFAMNSRTL